MIEETFVSSSISVPHMTANEEPQEITSEKNLLLADMQPLFDEKVIIIIFFFFVRIAVDSL